jgi:hypothetical protein
MRTPKGQPAVMPPGASLLFHPSWFPAGFKQKDALKRLNRFKRDVIDMHIPSLTAFAFERGGFVAVSSVLAASGFCCGANATTLAGQERL